MAYQNSEMSISRWVKTGIAVVLWCLSGSLSATFAESEQPAPLNELYIQGRELIEGWDGDVKKLDAAEVLFRQLLDRDQRFAPAYAGLAEVALQRGYVNYGNFQKAAFEKSFQLIEQALAADPQNAIVYQTRGSIKLKQHDRAGARQDAERALALDPAWAYTHRLLAGIASDEGNWTEAVAQYHRAMELADGQPEFVTTIHGTLAALYRSQKKYEDAEKEYRTVLVARPDSPWAWINFCEFLLDKPDVDGAIAACEHSLSLGNSGMGRYLMAQAYAQKGHNLFWSARDEQAARPWLEKALTFSPLHDALYTLGVYWKRAAARSPTEQEFGTSKALALKYFQAALTVDPKSPLAAKEAHATGQLTWQKKQP